MHAKRVWFLNTLWLRIGLHVKHMIFIIKSHSDDSSTTLSFGWSNVSHTWSMKLANLAFSSLKKGNLYFAIESSRLDFTSIFNNGNYIILLWIHVNSGNAKKSDKVLDWIFKCDVYMWTWMPRNLSFRYIYVTECKFRGIHVECVCISLQ